MYRPDINYNIYFLSHKLNGGNIFVEKFNFKRDNLINKLKLILY